MKKLLLVSLFVLPLFFTACKDDDKSTTPAPVNTDITVTAVAPTTGTFGTVVTVTGTNFGTDKAAVTVTFGSTGAVIDTIIGGTTIKTKVPAGAVLGDLQIKVTKSSLTKTIDFHVVDQIVGSWLCEGANVPYGLKVAPFRVIKIVATFNENKSYTVVQTDSSNVNTTLSGTYTNTASTNYDTASTSITKTALIYNIVANQSTPNAITATGIYAIKGTSMSYEVIQTNPSLGVSPPTPQGGFGSTAVGSTKYPIYIQKYVKQ